jgi:hypothetical protein
MSTIFFPFRPRPEDEQAALVVQRNLEFLAGLMDDLVNSSDSGSGVVVESATASAISFLRAIENPHVIATPTVGSSIPYWVSNKTNTGFIFNLQTAAPVGGVTFDWIARGG